MSSIALTDIALKDKVELSISDNTDNAMKNKQACSTPDWLENYQSRGYHYPIAAFSESQASIYKTTLEQMESRYAKDNELRKLAIGHANALLPFADEITRLPSVLNAVKAVLGNDLLVWNASFFIKEPNTKDFISWHQDLTYWGLDDSHEVTAWVALSPSTIESGCVKFVPGSHQQNIVEHNDTFHENNLLSRGQELAVDVNEEDAVNIELQAGEMSLHHGKVFHSSNFNQSNYRRIGLAIRYITPNMKQTTNDKTHARLVAGKDAFGHFKLMNAPQNDLDPNDVAAVEQNKELTRKFLFAGTNKA